MAASAMGEAVLEAGLSNLVDAIRAAAVRRPDRRAVTWSGDGDREDRHLTFGALDRTVRSLAARLQADGLQGERAMLIFEPGLDFVVAFVACLYAGVVPVPAYPPEPHRMAHTLARLKSIVIDAEAKVVLTSPLIRGFAETLVAQANSEAISALAWITVDETGAHTPEAWVRPAITDEGLAFLQYTSGSTSQPKGVLITHGSLWADLEMAREAYGLSGEAVVVSWLPLYHDMGLLGTLLGPLGLGAEVWLMPPHAFLKRPARWLSWMSKVGCTHTAAPNFAFDLCVRKTPQEVLERLDLSRVQVIVNGAEPVRRDTLDRFNQTFAAAGLNPDAVSPSFGLAEVGLFASVAPKGRRLSHLTLAKGALARHRVQAALPGEPEAVAVVSCGVAWGDARFEVVHPERRTRVGGGQVGEIWIAGGHVARGYWRQPELSEAAFRARLADDPEAGPFLRTGDLGFVQDGDLYITGRRKDLLIIRGRNLYPQDIERSLDGTREALPEVRPGCAAAVAIQVDGVEQLAVFQEVEPGRNAAHDPEQVVSALRDAVLRDHEVRPHTVVLLAKGSLPKTSSGKVMRFACKRALERDFTAGDLKAVRVDRLADAAAAPAVDPQVSAAAAERVLGWLRGEGARWLADGLHPAALAAAGAHGLFGLQALPDEGGLGLSHGDALRVWQQLGALHPGLGVTAVLHHAFGVGLLSRHGSEAQQARWLHALAAGRALATVAWAEPTGASPASLTTRWTGERLDGAKGPVSAAPWASLFLVLARAGDGHALLAVDRHRAGVTVTAGEALGLAAPPRGALCFQGVAADDADRVGPMDGALAVADEAMTEATLGLAAVALGVAQRAVQHAVAFAGRRPIPNGWLLDHPAVLDGLHGLLNRVVGVEATLQAVAAAQDAGQPVPGAWIRAARTAATDLAWDAATQAADVLGARGVEAGHPVAALRQDAAALRASLGTPQALRDRVGAELLADPAAVLAPLAGLGAAADDLAQAAAAVPTGGRVDGARQHAHQALALGLEAALARAALAGREDPGHREAAQVAGDQVAQAIQALGAHSRRGLSARALTQRVRAATLAIGPLPEPAAAPQPAASPAGPAAPAPVRPVAPQRAAPPVPPSAPARAAAPAPAGGEADRLKAWMVRWLARELGMVPRALEQRLGTGQASLSALGIDSVVAVQLVGALEDKLGVAIPASTLHAHDDLDGLARHLVARRGEAGARR